MLRYLEVDINVRMFFTSHAIKVTANSEKMSAMLEGLMPNEKKPSISIRRLLAEVINSVIMYATSI